MVNCLCIYHELCGPQLKSRVLSAEVYKPILEEIERIQAEAGLDDDDVVSAQRVKASGTGADSRHRR